MHNSPIVEALYRVKRALVGHISYLAACEANTVFSEYILYETVFRALSGQGFGVMCEVPCDWLQKPAGGDWKRIDFRATKPQVGDMAIEVKWENKTTIDIQNDVNKLTLFLDQFPNIRAFLCVFGVASKITNVRPSAFTGEDADHLNTYPRVEVGSLCIADLKVTKFSCRVFEVKRLNEAFDPMKAWNPA